MEINFNNIHIYLDDDEIRVNAQNLSEIADGRGLYINSSDNVVNYNGIDIPTHSILFPDDSTLNLQNFFSGYDYIEFTGSSYNDYFNAGKLDSHLNWSPGNDFYISEPDDNGNIDGNVDFNNWYWHQPAEIRNEQGLEIDKSSGTILVSTDYGTTTAINTQETSGTWADDIITGSAIDEKFSPNGGNDIINGGAGNDQFENIFSFQTKLTITDYESYEEIEFEDAHWDPTYIYNFSKEDIHNQFSIRYDEELGNTYISLSTDSITKDDLVVLNNGNFELSHFSLEDNLTGLEIFLKDENASNKEWYYIGNDVDVFGIKGFDTGDKLIFDGDFEFDSQNYADQISTIYNENQNQTFINLNTDNFSKDGIAVIDGNFTISSFEPEDWNSNYRLTLNENSNSENPMGWFMGWIILYYSTSQRSY